LAQIHAGQRITTARVQIADLFEICVEMSIALRIKEAGSRQASGSLLLRFIQAFIMLKQSSIGLRSGEYGGKKTNAAPMLVH
jgi:hypothetical protein